MAFSVYDGDWLLISCKRKKESEKIIIFNINVLIPVLNAYHILVGRMGEETVVKEE